MNHFLKIRSLLPNFLQFWEGQGATFYFIP